MKMLFRTGKIITNESKKEQIYFETTGNDIEDAFSVSLDRLATMTSMFNAQFYKNVNGKDIFYLHEKRIDKETIEEEISSVISGNVSNVINYEDIFIKENIYEENLNFAEQSTIFWDVLNHIIIVIGKNSLENLIYLIEKERWKNVLDLFPGNNELTEIIPEGSFSSLYNKAKKL